MRGWPPVLVIAVGFAAGAAAGTAPGSGGIAFAAFLAAAPILLLRGPRSRAAVVWLCAAAGFASALAARRSKDRCTEGLADGAPAVVSGYFVQASARASTFRTVAGPGSRCGATVSVFARDGAPPEARFVAVEGRWVRAARPDGSESLYLGASSVRLSEGRVPLAHRIRTAVRERAAEAVRRRLGAQAGVASALVLAEREGIAPELRDAFARSGSAHLLSISGFHVGVIVGLLGAVAALAGASPRGRAAWVAVGVWAYVLAIGAPTSATRAAWMATAFVAGRLRRAPARALGALGFSMLMLVLADPAVAAGAGFQLTVAGTAGILVLAKWILGRWPAHRGRGWIAPPVAAGLGASLFTAPVLAWHFGEVPLLSLPSSILLTPLVAAAVPGILLTIVLDVLRLPGAALAGSGAEGLLHAVTATARVLGSVPGSVVLATPSEAALLAVGAALPLLLGGASSWRVRPLFRAGAAATSACVVLWLGQAALSLAGRGRLEVVAIDVGQGDAIAVRTPAGRWLLVDAGPRFSDSDAGLTRVVPYLRGRGVRRLEAVVLTHPDEDHAGGLASVLRHLPAAVVLGPGFGGGQSGHMAGLQEARDAGIPWRRAAAGDAWTIDGVSFQVLSPDPPAESGREAVPSPGSRTSPGSRAAPEARPPPGARTSPEPRRRAEARPESPNDWSVVLRVSYGEFDALLMGDADARIEERLTRRGEAGPAELLKVGHHGSRTSTSESFLLAVRPAYALVSAGKRNRYGHPAPEVLARLGRSGARVLRTDLHGTASVVARPDGSASVRTQR